ncbi:MAG: hypothetical protein A2Z70_01315 [Chloroflexi bacterium RBG_13_48_17]|nr:MAG: hypothetical protein A2Z70_01315 [Chloroflexi bacterium RBG_13_48_17]
MFGNNRQQTIIITPKGTTEKEKLQVGSILIARPDTYEAWELDYNQQARNEKNGAFVQFVSSWNKTPIKIFENRPSIKGQSTQIIAAQQFDEKLTQTHKAQQHLSQLLWLGIFGALTVIIIGLVILFNMR